MTLCDVRGLSMLVQAGATVGERGVACAVATAPQQVRRLWPMLWPAELPCSTRAPRLGVWRQWRAGTTTTWPVARSSADRGGADAGRHHCRTCPAGARWALMGSWARLS